MGGEPTFVSVDDRDGAEWNTEAMGPDKRRAGVRICSSRLQEQYAPTGLLHFGQGKWYPGEPLPRWSLSCFWRKDGEPVWDDPALFADEAQRQRRRRGAGARCSCAALAAQARRWIRSIVFPAYEDAWYYLWRERKLPANVDPVRCAARRPARARAAAQDLPPGPGQGRRAMSCRWRKAKTARWQHGPLVPARRALLPDSRRFAARPAPAARFAALGRRRPTIRWVHAPDPLPGAARPAAPLGKHAAAQRQRRSAKQRRRREPGAQRRSKSAARDHAHRDLRRAAQRRAATSSCRRPARWRITSSWSPRSRPPPPNSAMPVIARRLRAAARSAPAKCCASRPTRACWKSTSSRSTSWAELVDNTDLPLRRGAPVAPHHREIHGRRPPHRHRRRQPLRARRRRPPADSPFLRRPDLLASLLAYWHNHPSLSYLFSGLFIGPTSQHPRVDEARNDSRLRAGDCLRADCGSSRRNRRPPWLVDRLFRNLLIDATGNTHRAEFCIDKLYSPDGPTGRLGLLELRAFEMPPHARMRLTQQLLLRALVARFWQRALPAARLARWGTELHDRFMLPHFVWQDFEDVIDETRRGRLRACEPEWFAPHFEFRFPRIGEFAARGIALRTAHGARAVARAGRGRRRRRHRALRRFLGRAPAGAAPPASTGERHVLTCNGRALPLHAHRQRRRVRRRRALPRLAALRRRCIRPSACTRRSSSTSSTPG